MRHAWLRADRSTNRSLPEAYITRLHEQREYAAGVSRRVSFLQTPYARVQGFNVGASVRAHVCMRNLVELAETKGQRAERVSLRGAEPEMEPISLDVGDTKATQSGPVRAVDRI